jgi:hypothetical protein
MFTVESRALLISLYLYLLPNIMGMAAAQQLQSTQILNRDLIEKNMRTVVPPEAQCGSDNNRSYCEVRENGNYYFQLNYYEGVIVASIFNGQRSPLSFSRDKASLIRFIGTFGFTPNEIASCILRLDQSKVVYQNLILECHSTERLFAIRLSANTSFDPNLFQSFGAAPPSEPRSVISCSSRGCS